MRRAWLRVRYGEALPILLAAAVPVVLARGVRAAAVEDSPSGVRDQESTMRRDPRAAALLEAALEDNIIATAKMLGWHVHAQRAGRTKGGWRTSIKGDVGFPDLVLARGGRVIFAELKRAGQNPRPEQRAWLDLLGGIVWDTGDWYAGRIEAELT